MIYPIDPTGISPSNRIIDEIQVVMPPGEITDATFFVPRVNPFFRMGLVIKHGSRTLIENVDYQLVFRSVALSEHFERELFGGIMLVNRHFEGTVKVSYQVLGGDFQFDDYELLERLARVSGAIRWVTYDQLIGVPSNFPPAYHTHDIETDLVNMGVVVDAVERIATALDNAPASLTEVNERMTAHLTQTHAHTKEQIGLGDIENLPVATDMEVTSGARKYVTADSLKKQLPGMVLENMPPPAEIPTPPEQVELPGTTDKINQINQDIINLNTALTSNGRADTTWRTNHVKVADNDPHPQYVPTSEMNRQLGILMDKIESLEEQVNTVPEPGGSGPLGTIKAFWTFHTPVTDRGYPVAGTGVGLPLGPTITDGMNRQINPSVIAQNATVKRYKDGYQSGGEWHSEEYYHLLMVEFIVTFDFELSDLVCTNALNQVVTITKVSNRRYRLTLPDRDRNRGEYKQWLTPLNFTVR